MKTMYWIVALLALAACGNSQETLTSRLRKADLVEVTFYHKGGQETTVTLKDPAILDSLSQLISETPSEALKCGYDGEIKYQQGDSLIFSGEFNLAADCGHIAYMEGGETRFRKLSSPHAAILSRLKAARKPSKLEPLAWFIGRWTQVEGPDLVSYEEWVRHSDTLWQGQSWTLYHTDTVFQEKIALKAEGEDIYYIPTVKENKGPVRFKMTQLEGKSAVFENPEHDFPTKITYEARGDTLLFATISGDVKGKQVVKEFPLKRAGN